MPLIERISPELIVALSAAAAAEIDHEGECDNRGSDKQKAFNHTDMIGIAAHSQEIGKHQHRVRYEQPTDQLPGPVAIVQPLHHNHGLRIKQSEIDEKAQEAYRERIRGRRGERHIEKKAPGNLDGKQDQPAEPECRTADAALRAGKQVDESIDPPRVGELSLVNVRHCVAGSA